MNMTTLGRDDPFIHQVNLNGLRPMLIKNLSKLVVPNLSLLWDKYSGIRSALQTTTNQRLASPSGEGTIRFPIPYPHQSTNSLPLDPLDESTPNYEQFVNSQSGEDEDNQIHMANICHLP